METYKWKSHILVFLLSKQVVQVVLDGVIYRRSRRQDKDGALGRKVRLYVGLVPPTGHEADLLLASDLLGGNTGYNIRMAMK